MTTTNTPAPMTGAEYVEAAARACPYCCGVTRHGSPEPADRFGTVRQQSACHDCAATWTTLHRPSAAKPGTLILVGYDPGPRSRASGKPTNTPRPAPSFAAVDAAFRSLFGGAHPQ